MMDGRANRSKMENVEGAEIAIDKSIAQGMEAGDVKKLQDAGIEGLSEAKVDEILEAAEKLEKMETFKRRVEELELQVQQLGRKAALLILDEAGTDIALALAFPPNEKLKYANILIGDSYYEYEDDEAKNNISEKEKEEADHAFVDQLEVDNQVLRELVSAQKEVDALRFRKVIEHAKTNLKQMSISEITDLISQSRSLIDASRGEIKIHVEKLTDFKEQLNKKMG